LERQLTIRRVSLDALIPDPANARQHGEANTDAITAALQRIGQPVPLVVHASTGRVIGGNGRLVAMSLQGTLDASLFDAAKGACHGAAA
jgi:nucleoside-diphosphate-sugar epimerase